MRAGLLRHRLEIQESDGVPQNTFGEPQAPTWTTRAHIWGDVSPLMGRERMTAQQVQAEVTHNITIRNLTIELSAAYRIKFGERIFGILEILRPKERKISVTIMAKEEVA